MRQTRRIASVAVSGSGGRLARRSGTHRGRRYRCRPARTFDAASRASSTRASSRCSIRHRDVYALLPRDPRAQYLIDALVHAAADFDRRADRRHRPGILGAVARVFIAGSAEGLRRAAATTLFDAGHHVVIQAVARNDSSQCNMSSTVAPRRSPATSRTSTPPSPSAFANALEPMDAVIHNAGVYSGPRSSRQRHRARLLTAVITRPRRLAYLSSGMHRGSRADLIDIDGTAAADPVLL